MASRRKTLNEQRFEKLVGDLQLLLESASQSASNEKARGYWDIGKRISEERLLRDAGYHNSVLRDLARSAGVSARTLQRSVVFHRVYKKPPSDGLSWMHYQLLSSLDNNAERQFYQKRAAAEAWTVRELREAIRFDLFLGGELDPPLLKRPDFLEYCYIARPELVVDGDTLDLDIDLGFSSWTKRRIRLAHVDCPEIRTAAGRAARNFVAEQVARASTIVLQSYKSDLYGRYVGFVFLSAEETSLRECFHTGRFLNDLLVRHGHAVVVR